jgi:hypothetical protein
MRRPGDAFALSFLEIVFATTAAAGLLQTAAPSFFPTAADGFLHIAAPPFFPFSLLSRALNILSAAISAGVAAVKP